MRMVLCVAAVLLMVTRAAAADFKIFDLRNRLQEESKAIHASLKKSADPLVLTTMFDSCLIAMNQIDSYYYMLAMFETVKKADAAGRGASLLYSWLAEIQRTNDLTITGLNTIAIPLEDATKAHRAKLLAYLAELNVYAQADMSKLERLRKAADVITSAPRSPAAKPQKR